ncbi:hypothetical protein QBC47DRAFT_382985 [Echria macrotheca]|uniref:Casein kinase II beta 2 subunit n=1 Tax=Echria macrotheca TaxID=438768 RepID=A0AAJ0BBF2_9PEZI|nr:hypothetical protein QBC47DRAFT_382985 [Echria macrotheca]
MPPGGGFLATAALRVVSKNLGQAVKVLRSKLVNATRPVNSELQPVTVRNTPNNSSRQPVHPAAWLRQQKRSAKFYSSNSSSHVHANGTRHFSTSGGGRSAASGGPRVDRSRLPVSRTSKAVGLFTGRAPFACTLRPNLTGGALPRSAGGYGMPGGGGGARYFSHTPAAPAEVIQNVSQAMRAFLLNGHRARYDGVGPNGQKRYKAVSATQEEHRKRLASIPRHAPGSYVDFQVSPTITALSPLGVVFPFATAEGFGVSVKPQPGAATLHTDGFLDVLSVDFARALQDLAAIMTDLKNLSALGDLPVTLEKNSVLRVRFPGVDADTVERLCDEVGIRRGIIRQDADFESSVGVPMALRFPFAPDGKGDENNCCGVNKTITSPGGSVRSRWESGGSAADSSELDELFLLDEYEENPWLLSSPEPEPEGYESASPPLLPRSYTTTTGEHVSSVGDFEGLEGIYRFIEECDRARVR